MLVLSQYVEPVYTAELLAPARAASATCSRSASATCAAFVDAVQRVARGGTALDREVVAELVRARDGPPATRSPR